MSAELLLRAATKVRELAGEVGEHVGLSPEVIDGPPLWFAATAEYDESGDAVHDHIALWSPLIALSVADWLAMTAGAHDHLPNGTVLLDVWSMPGMEYHPAIRLARLILGEDT